MTSHALKVYIADPALLPSAEKIVAVTRHMTGECNLAVDIEVAAPPNYVPYPAADAFNQNYNFPTWNSNFSTLSNQVTGTTTSATTYTQAQGNNFYIQTPSTTNQTTTQWTNAPYTVNIGSAGKPLEPDQVPTSESFEQMLIASIKQLNEAYSLGRLHGFVEGKSKGVAEVYRELEEAQDCDPLTYAEVSSPSV